MITKKHTTGTDHPIFTLFPGNWKCITKCNKYGTALYWLYTNVSYTDVENLLTEQGFIRLDSSNMIHDFNKWISKEHYCQISFYIDLINVVISPDKQTFNDDIERYIRFTADNKLISKIKEYQVL